MTHTNRQTINTVGIRQIFITVMMFIEMFKMKYGGKIDLDKLSDELNDIDYCYVTSNKVSRSFSFVIEELPESNKNMQFVYLILYFVISVVLKMI